MNTFTVGSKRVGLEGRVFIIAEVAQAHDGSLGTAHAFIDAVADTGVDAIKFQTHIASAESTPAEPWRVKFSRQDKTRYDYWRRMEFSQEQWRGLLLHAQQKKLIFLSSPFSLKAVELLEKIGIQAWKIASGEVGNDLLLHRIIESRLPVLMSSGMSSIAEIDRAIKFFQNKSCPFAVFQCSSYYPCPPEKVGLNMLSFFRKRYLCPVGLSDHSGTVFPSFAAVTLGAQLIEIHVTLSRKMFGPDVQSSVTVDELKYLVDGVRFIENMQNNPVDKESVAEELQPMRELFTKSVVATSDLAKGTVLAVQHLTVKKPGMGFPPEKLPELIGCCLRKDIKEDHIIMDEDIDWEFK